MIRVKRGFVARKRRKKVIKLNQGFRGSHSKLFRTANQQMMKALAYSYSDRKKKKRQIKKVWILRINAASRKEGLLYNEITNKLKKKRIIINRKLLSEISLKDPEIIKTLINVK